MEVIDALFEFGPEKLILERNDNFKISYWIVSGQLHYSVSVIFFEDQNRSSLQK